VIGDASRAAAAGVSPKPEPYTEEVYRAVAAEVPALLRRWDAESVAGQFALACLAALFPDVMDLEGWLTAAVEAMAVEYAHTQQGAYLELAASLLRGDEDRALSLAYDIVCLEENAEPQWLVAPGSPMLCGPAKCLPTAR
jgi:hypothetical protein